MAAVVGGRTQKGGFGKHECSQKQRSCQYPVLSGYVQEERKSGCHNCGTSRWVCTGGRDRPGKEKAMGFLFDRITKSIPAEEALELTEEAREAMGRQEHVWSLHPQRPEDVEYVGTGMGAPGYANDYYVDRQGVYWYESRPEKDPVALKFIYDGMIRNRRGMRRRAPVA